MVEVTAGGKRRFFTVRAGIGCCGKIIPFSSVKLKIERILH